MSNGQNPEIGVFLFKCNYRGKGVSMIGSFTGKVIK